jgi:hypothetical protein
VAGGAWSCGRNGEGEKASVAVGWLPFIGNVEAVGWGPLLDRPYGQWRCDLTGTAVRAGWHQSSEQGHAWVADEWGPGSV